VEGALLLEGGRDELLGGVCCGLIGGNDGWRDLLRQGVGVGFDDLRSDGVAAGGDHELSEPLAGDFCLGTETLQHGVGFPTSDELDGVRINIGAEESCGSKGLHRVGADVGGLKTGDFLDRVCCLAQASGDMAVGNAVPFTSPPT
jgi:hypothetical protein